VIVAKTTVLYSRGHWMHAIVAVPTSTEPLPSVGW